MPDCLWDGKAEKLTGEPYPWMMIVGGRVLQSRVFADRIRLGDTEKRSIPYIKENPPEFSNNEEFARYCFNGDEEKMRIDFTVFWGF